MAAQKLKNTVLFQDANLQALYELDNGALTTDSKGSSTLTNNNTVTSETTNQLFGTGAANFGAANTNKYLSIASNLGTDGASITISLWVKLLAEITSGTYCLAEQIGNTSKTAYTINYNYNSGTPQIEVVRNKIGTGSDHVVHSITLGTSSWHLIELTYDGSSLYLYIDGTQYGPITTSGNGSVALANSFNLASAQAGGNYASVLLDDAAVFNRALSAQEVSDLFTGADATTTSTTTSTTTTSTSTTTTSTSTTTTTSTSTSTTTTSTSTSTTRTTTSTSTTTTSTSTSITTTSTSITTTSTSQTTTTSTSTTTTFPYPAEIISNETVLSLEIETVEVSGLPSFDVERKSEQL